MTDTRKLMLMAAAVLGAMPALAELPARYPLKSTADSLMRATKVDRSKVKTARKQKHKKPRKGGAA